MKYFFYYMALALSIIKCHGELITFESPPFIDGGKIISNYVEGGVSLSGHFVHWGTLNSIMAANDSEGYITIPSFGGNVTIEMIDSGVFNLESISLSEYSTVFAGQQKTVTFTGYYSDGSSTSESFITDGLIDSIGGVDDFETFTFSDNFSNLAYVEVLTTGFAFDDVVITAAIPEPASILLLLLGGLLTGMYRKQ